MSGLVPGSLLNEDWRRDLCAALLLKGKPEDDKRDVTSARARLKQVLKRIQEEKNG